MWRNCIWSVAVIFGFLVWWQGSVFAQTNISYCEQTTICGTAPVEFNLMLSLVQELLTTIKTVGTKSPYLGEYVNPNWFVGNEFSPPKQNMVDDITTAIGQRLNYIAATTAIFVAPQQLWWLKVFFAGMINLFQQEIFARDTRRVEQLESEITQKRYELGMGGGWSKTVRAENVTKIWAVLDSYKSKWLITTFSLSDDMTYSDVMSFASTVLSSLRKYLSLNSIDYFSLLERSRGIRVTLSPNIITSLDRQYTCARSPISICSKDLANFKDQMSTLAQSTYKKMLSGFQLFRTETKRLQKVFDENPPKQDELLASYYGNTNYKNGKRITVNTGNMLSVPKDIISQWRSLVVKEQSSSDIFVDTVPVKEKEVSSVSKTDLTYTNINTLDTSTRSFVSWISDRMAPLMEYQKRDLALIYFSEVKDFSKGFDDIGKSILGVKTVIGNKDAENSLISIFGQSCEMQCGSIFKKCY